MLEPFTKHYDNASQTQNTEESPEELLKNPDSQLPCPETDLIDQRGDRNLS